MKLGIIGLPQAGKNTVFEALTRRGPDGAHRGEPRIGTIPVPDGRVARLSAMYNPRKTIYAQVEYFLPGRGGKDGEAGLWPQVRDCDALIHVVRNFTAFGQQTPAPDRDFASLDQEMILADQVVVEKRLARLAEDKRRNRAVDGEERSLLEACLETLEEETPLRRRPDLAAAPSLRGFAFVSGKPLLVLFNNGDDDDRPPADSRLPAAENAMVIRAKIEQELGQMSAEEAADFLAEFEIAAAATDRVIRASYELLGLVSFFTVGEDEVRAWTIRENTAAVEAAGVIHSDISKGFIRAEAVAYDDLMTAGSHAEARKKGTVRLEGKTYPVVDGDIINFRFNV